MPTPTGRPLPRSRRIVSGVLILMVGAITVMCLVLFIALRLDDAQIESDPGVATATVLSVSPLRTGIEFVDATGQTIRPPGGVLYPGLLSVGQQFLVEYSLEDPTIARVAGRTASVADLPIALTVALTWVIGGILWWLLRRRRPVAADAADEGEAGTTDPDPADRRVATEADLSGARPTER
ncbi:DUF3592 domain-containing protein [Nakamurella sp. YIM 132087]|uniref:DUF3592 domain-containing protein n=1 Tax=Nakamurella alba TaxID=2665158 RepID=A0A7K1FK64_9ACTN|nr:DUF3592 domain-containing protein [Nakamurella alba]MTD14476.1 DUF3592 domain-containing protein [Nakamurella alba]